MLERIFSNIRWLLLAAIVAGPGWAYLNWTDLEKIRRVSSEGTEVTAFVDGGESRSGRRSGTSYTIHAIWPGAGDIQHAEDVAITSEYAKKIIQDDMLMIDTVQLKYIADDAAAPIYVVEDIPQQQQDKELMMWLGIGGGIVGAIGSAIIFFVGRRRAA